MKALPPTPLKSYSNLVSRALHSVHKFQGGRDSGEAPPPTPLKSYSNLVSRAPPFSTLQFTFTILHENGLSFPPVYYRECMYTEVKKWG